MEKDNKIASNADKIAENQKVMKGDEKEVVKGSENADTNLDSALNLENAKKLNREIGRRIIEIRQSAGMSQEKFYSLLYPDSEEVDTRKATRMGYIENAVAFDRDKNGKKISGAILLDFPRLLFISQHFNVPLNYLLYGEAEPAAETPPVLQAEKATTEKSETENDASQSPGDDPLRDTWIDYLLNSFRRPVCQISAAFLNLFKYANISIVGAYTLNNFETPQSLTIKISPKCFSVSGKSVPEEGLFYRTDKCIEYFYPDIDGLYDELEKIVYWDVRATFIQDLLATACQQNKKQSFFPSMLLNSIYLKMEYESGYTEWNDFHNFGYLSSISITDPNESPALGKGIFPLVPCEKENIEILKQCKAVPSNSKNCLPHFAYSDPLSCTLNCEYEKIPNDIKRTLSFEL